MWQDWKRSRAVPSSNVMNAEKCRNIWSIIHHTRLLNLRLHRGLVNHGLQNNPNPLPIRTRRPQARKQWNLANETEQHYAAECLSPSKGQNQTEIKPIFRPPRATPAGMRRLATNLLFTHIWGYEQTLLSHVTLWLRHEQLSCLSDSLRAQEETTCL